MGAVLGKLARKLTGRTEINKSAFKPNYRKFFLQAVRSTACKSSKDLIDTIVNYEPFLTRKTVAKGIFKAIITDNLTSFFILYNYFQNTISVSTRRKIMLSLVKHDHFDIAPTSLMVFALDTATFEHLVMHCPLKSLQHLKKNRGAFQLCRRITNPDVIIPHLRQGHLEEVALIRDVFLNGMDISEQVAKTVSWLLKQHRSISTIKRISFWWSSQF